MRFVTAFLNPSANTIRCTQYRRLRWSTVSCNFNHTLLIKRTGGVTSYAICVLIYWKRNSKPFWPLSIFNITITRNRWQRTRRENIHWFRTAPPSYKRTGDCWTNWATNWPKFAGSVRSFTDRPIRPNWKITPLRRWWNRSKGAFRQQTQKLSPRWSPDLLQSPRNAFQTVTG